MYREQNTMIPILPKSLISQMENNASDLLMKIIDEKPRTDGRQTEAEEDFFDLMAGLALASPEARFLADSYVFFYNDVQKKRVHNPELIRNLKKEYPINREKSALS